MLIKKSFLKIIDIILPQKCICGRNKTQDVATLCSECWAKVQFINGSQCVCCGDPFEINDADASSDMLCHACIEKPPLFSKQRCVFKYDENSSFIISKFKYSDATYIAKYLAPQLRNISSQFIDEVDVITSIPLHYKKLLRRKFNQASILANRLGKMTGKKVDNMLLKRVQDKPAQAGLEREDRIKNIKGSFAVQRKANFKGKAVLLVDDVITTGATISEAVKILLLGGASKVFVVAAARTLR